MRRSCLLLAALLALPLGCGAEPEASAAMTFATARELYTARRDTEAQAAFEQLLAADPAQHEAVYHLGRLAKRRGDWKTAAEYYERCTVLAPTNALYWVDLGEAYGKLARKAGLFQQLGLARKCRTALEKAVELAPENLEYRQGLLTFYEQAPSIAGGGHDKALAQATEITKLDPFMGAMTTGNLQARAKNWADAEAAFRSAEALRPQAVETAVALAMIFAEQRRFAEALTQLDQLLADHPDNLAALFQLGRVAADSGQRLADGAAAMHRVLAQPNLPKPQYAHYRLGQILARQGNTASARAAFETALQLDPKFKDASAELKKLQP